MHVYSNVYTRSSSVARSMATWADHAGETGARGRLEARVNLADMDPCPNIECIQSCTLRPSRVACALATWAEHAGNAGARGRLEARP